MSRRPLTDRQRQEAAFELKRAVTYLGIVFAACTQAEAIYEVDFEGGWVKLVAKLLEENQGQGAVDRLTTEYLNRMLESIAGDSFYEPPEPSAFKIHQPEAE